MHVVDFTSFYPPHVGGVEAYARELHAQLLAGPAELVTVVTSDQGEPPRYVGAGELVVARYRAVEPVAGFAMPVDRIIHRAQMALAGRAVDVVLSHTRFYPASLVAGAFARRRGARHVHIEHGGSPVASGGHVVRSIASSVDRTMGRVVLRGADRVISVSEASAAFVKRISGVHAEVARRGIALPAAPWCPEGQRDVLFVGRLVDGKGIFDAVRAMVGVDAAVRVIGAGPAADDVAREAERLGVLVQMLGPCAPDVVEAHMRACAVLVHPSHSEGLPTVVLEAAALGMPVVATDAGGTRDVITGGSDGWLVAPRDTAALASALREALADRDDAAERGAAARERVRREFSWAKVVSLIAPA